MKEILLRYINASVWALILFHHFNLITLSEGGTSIPITSHDTLHGTLTVDDSKSTEEQEHSSTISSVFATSTLSPKVQAQVELCEADINLMELCMRCAKVTKAIGVYPWCCGNEDGVTQWCKDYVYYGLQYRR